MGSLSGILFTFFVYGTKLNYFCHSEIFRQLTFERCFLVLVPVGSPRSPQKFGGIISSYSKHQASHRDGEGHHFQSPEGQIWAVQGILIAQS